ncbi:MAG TPA: hypothetical protein ENN09_02950 [Planctomycetes bacterium]|nr:hypothetical protein [Planctomycetota bacterium]
MQKAATVIVAATMVFSTGATAEILEPGPYVSCVTDNGVTVNWITNTATAVNAVEYGTTAAYGSSVPSYQDMAAEEDTGTYYVHSARITGLSASATYYYRVVSDAYTSDNEGAGWTVATFPAVGTQDFSFVVYGDSRYAGESNTHLLWHEKVMRGVSKEPVPLILHGGDAISRTDRLIEWSGSHPSSGDPQGEFFRIAGGRFKVMQSKWIAVCKGNHELMGDYPTLYGKVFENPYSGNGLGVNASEDYFAFDYANARIIFLRHNGSEGFRAFSGFICSIHSGASSSGTRWE